MDDPTTDYGDLRALYLNCTLKRSPEFSQGRNRVAVHAQARVRTRHRGDVAVLPGEKQGSARAESTRYVLARHPWAISIKARTSPGRATLGHALSLLDSYVQGFAQQEAALPLDASGDISAATQDIIAQQEAMAESFPHLAEMAASLILQPEYAYGNEFEFGLELILDGIDSARSEGRDAAARGTPPPKSGIEH